MQNNTFSGLFVGQNIITLQTVDSTNNYLKQQLSKSTPLAEGTVILAEEQIAGRGQYGNQWISEPYKNLTFSLLLKPSFLRADEQFILNKCISIAINEALNEIKGVDVAIKWPNDIYCGGQKLGGILIENYIRGNFLSHAIIGIGINVNQQVFPPELARATSLYKILHTDYDLTILLSQLCSYIERWYLKLRSGAIGMIEKCYVEKLYALGKLARFRTAAGKEITGTIKDVQKSGLLVVDSEDLSDGYNLKEIEFLHLI